MAKAKRRVGKKKAAKKKKTVARRKPAAKRKPAAAPLQRPIVIPGAWPFPMGSKS